MAPFPEGIGFGKLICDPFQCGTGGSNYKSVRRVEPPVEFYFEGGKTDLGVAVPCAFDAWRRLRVACLPGPTRNGITHMTGAFAIPPARGYNGVGAKICDAEENVRDADALKHERSFEYVKGLVLMKIMFEKLMLHIQRQGPHTNKHAYDRLSLKFNLRKTRSTTTRKRPGGR